MGNNDAVGGASVRTWASISNSLWASDLDLRAFTILGLAHE